MKDFWGKISLIWNDKELRNRVFFVFGMLVVFRFISNIPIPGVDVLKLRALFSSNQFFGLLNIFSGGGLHNLSVVMLGVGPYITSSIIMQLLTMIFPSMKEMYQEEGEAGRRKFAQYSRILSVPLAMLQSFGFLVLLQKQGVLSASLTSLDQVVNVFIITAGSVLLMWLGELINEYGIGNGVSLIIFAGIVSRIPTTISQLFYQFDASQIPLYVMFIVVAIVTIAAVVVITEAERPIPVTYAKRVRGSKVYGGVSTYIPLRLNQAGVIPIIFALSILLFPQMLVNLLSGVNNAVIAKIAEFLSFVLNNQVIYGVAYFLLVMVFTYFYTAVTFDPDQIADNLQKGGAFIPGVRPGNPTSEYIAKITTRLTLFGSVFLGLVAILPLIMRAITGDASLAIGGTALLIVVSVVIELIKQIDAQVAMREY
ncbi:MAG: preprotein translocase subunit SecY [Candidatus Vogelbacteria bacterium]|nr:preprotein translocase subunit SecY [Candidatus Vogelbacteria bacterium]